MRRLVARGMAVIFITHKLNEALAYGDRITVLRLGRKVGEIGPEALKAAAPEETTAEIVRLMFGETPAAAAGEVRAPKSVPAGPAFLSVRGLSVADDAVPVTDVDLDVSAGEILGIAGIDGNGQKQLAEALAGQRLSPAGRSCSTASRSRVSTSPAAARRVCATSRRPPPRRHRRRLPDLAQPRPEADRRTAFLDWWNRASRPDRGARPPPRRRLRHVRTPESRRRSASSPAGNIQKALLARDSPVPHAPSSSPSHLRARRAEHPHHSPTHSRGGRPWACRDPDLDRPRGGPGTLRPRRRHGSWTNRRHRRERPGRPPPAWAPS